MADDDGFTFFLPPVVEGEAPAINVVYLIDISSSMGRASDGGAASPSSPSRLDLAKQALLALNQRLIDDGLADRATIKIVARSEEHTSELQSLMRISYAVFCLKKKT